MSTPIVKLNKVSKRFPGVLALNQVSLELYDTQVLGLVGENGAGKSTLMKILSGVYPSGEYEGQIFVNNQLASFSGPTDAEKLGIAIIHQELSTFPHLTVCENIYSGHWPLTSHGLIDWERAHYETSKWLQVVGATCSSDEIIGNLSIGTQQLVEIAKALARNSQILILDEPTSSLTVHESKKLFELIFKLKSEGKALIYISHKMEEIFMLCDRIAVLRDGALVFETVAANTDTSKLIEQMVGRAITDIYPKPPERNFNEVCLDVSGLTFSLDNNPDKKVGPLSFQLRRGEILGFGGLLGSGRTEFMRGLFGDENILKVMGGAKLSSRELSFQSPREALKEGISFVSEDRKGESILPSRSLSENETLAWLSSQWQGLSLPIEKLDEKAKNRLRELKTKYSDIAQLITELSGGNQQKVIIGRAMETNAKVIILDEPTRGIDVSAKKEVYDIIFNLAKSGQSILLVSSDLPELMALSDRIIMMRNGQMAGELSRPEFSQVNLMRLAFG